MGQTLRTARGFDRTWNSVLKNDGVVTPYPDDASFDSAVWRGGDEATLFSPTAAWIDASQATFTVSVVPSQTAGLDPGLYRFQVGVSSGGIRSLAFDGNLEILETPGEGTLRVPYVTGHDLLYWYDQLGTLQTIKGGDATFLEQRCDASDEFDRALVTLYDPRPGFVKRRLLVPDPILGFDVPDPTAVPPSPARLSAYLKAGGLIVDTNMEEAVSKQAIARVLERQEVMGSVNPYRAQADAFRAEAIAIVRRFDAQVDTDLDGVADLLVGRDVILLPTGTAP